MNKKYCIYLHKNKLNNKVYIGQTCQKPEYRWNNGEGYKNCSYFYKAIQKYGWDNFEHIILEQNLTLNEANEKEEYYIKLYNSIDSKMGYNLSYGGNNKNVSNLTKEKCSQNMKEFWQNEEHRKNMSEKMKEKWKDPEYRKKQESYKKEHKHNISEEGRKKISEARKEYIKKHGTPTQGVGHTEEAKEKIRQSKLGEKNPMYGKHHTTEWKEEVSKKLSKSIKCLETGQIFNSRKEAAEWCGLKSSSGISDCLSGRKKSAGKHPISGVKLHWIEI